MNYAGKRLRKNIPKNEVYDFLKKALKKVNTKSIFRGPKELKKNFLTYRNKTAGGINNFCGQEEIYFKDKKVYELKYHGGFIEN